MSSIISSQGVFLATAMAAVSGTVILLAAIRHQKTQPRPRLSSATGADDDDGNMKLKKKNKKKKRVHFAEDVVEPRGDGVEFRKRHGSKSSSNLNSKHNSASSNEERRITGMPANRVALYSGMIRDRVGHRLAYCY